MMIQVLGIILFLGLGKGVNEKLRIFMGSKASFLYLFPYAVEAFKSISVSFGIYLQS